MAMVVPKKRKKRVEEGDDNKSEDEIEVDNMQQVVEGDGEASGDRRPSSGTVDPAADNNDNGSKRGSGFVPLNATEFAAVLNSDYNESGSSPTAAARAVLTCLRRFVATVKRERKAALAGLAVLNEEDGRDGVDDEEEEEEEEEENKTSKNDDSRRKKKRRKGEESWKEDSASYNVPFVGTSVFGSSTLAGGGGGATDSGSSAAAAAPVVVGEWPTGFLKAYLDKSPVAVELTGNQLVVLPSASSNKSATAAIADGSNIHKVLLRRKEHKLSQAIYKAYLRALAELVTAAVPIQRLRRMQQQQQQQPSDGSGNATNRMVTEEEGVGETELDENIASPLTTTTAEDHTSTPMKRVRFLSEILKERLPELLVLIKDETASGKGLASLKGGVGPAVPLAVKVISRLVLTSVQTSRFVVRALEQGLPDAVMRLLLRPQQQQQQQSSSQSPSLILPRQKARVAALELVTFLVAEHFDDPAIMNMISTVAHKERKIPAGLLLLALRDGLSVVTAAEMPTNNTVESSLPAKSAAVKNALPRQLCAFLRVVRTRVLERNLLSKSTVRGLFSEQAVERLGQLAATAPPLSSLSQSTFEDVLAAQDSGTIANSNDKSDNDGAAAAGREARRLLFLLLGDTCRSPFLELLRGGDSIINNETSNKYAKSSQQIVVRALTAQMTAGNSNSGGGLFQMQRFWKHCVTETPALLPPLFVALSPSSSFVPADMSHKQSFAYVARLNGISQLLRAGPSINACLFGTEEESARKGGYNNKRTRFDDSTRVLRTLLPSALKKPLLSKALQSPNPLVVSETLKLLVFAIERLEKFLRLTQSSTDVDSGGTKNGGDSSDRIYSLANEDEDEEKKKRHLAEAFARALPDLQIILRVLNRFSSPSSGVATHFVVRQRVYGLLRAFAALVPERFHEETLSIDWTKQLLPSSSSPSSDAGVFCRSQPAWLQRSLLLCLQDMLQVQKKHAPSVQAGSCRQLLHIVIGTQIPAIFVLTRSICLQLFNNGVKDGEEDAETRACRMYEYSCWIDGMTAATVDDFCHVWQEASRRTLHNVLNVAQAWKVGPLPGPMPNAAATAISPTLVQALLRMPKGTDPSNDINPKKKNMSPQFALLACQVAGKCLLYQHNPLPLAVLINYDNEDKKVSCITKGISLALGKYSRSLVFFDQFKPADRGLLLWSMLQSYFSGDSCERTLAIVSSKGITFPPSHPTVFWESGLVQEDSLALLRHLVHCATISVDQEDHKRYLEAIRRVLPVVLLRQQPIPGPSDNWTELIYTRVRNALPAHLDTIDMMILACKSSRTCSDSPISQQEEKERAKFQSLLSAESNDNDFFTPALLRSSVVFIYFISPMLPLQSIEYWTSNILECCRRQLNKEYDCEGVMFELAAKLLQLWIPYADQDYGVKNNAQFGSTIFDAWRSLSLAVTRDNAKSISLVLLLEDVLSKIILKDGSLMSAALYRSILKSEPHDIVQNCLRTKKEASALSDRGQQECFLAALINCNRHHFAPIFLSEFRIKQNEDEIQQLLNFGFLDNALFCTLEDTHIIEENASTVTSIAEKLIDRIVNVAPETQTEDTDLNLPVSILLLASSTLMNSGKTFSGGLVERMTKLVTKIPNLRNLPSLTESQLFQLSLGVCKATKPADIPAVDILSSATLVSLCQRATVLVRLHMETADPQQKIDLFPDGKLLTFLCDLLENVKTYSNDYFENNGLSFLRKMLRTFLRYGIAPAKRGNTKIQTFCLRVVKCIVVGTLTPSSPLRSLYLTYGSPLASKVFEMVTSHSNFSEAIISAESTQECQRQLEMVRLLVACASSTEEMWLDGTVAKSLLRSFSASMSPIDTKKRVILALPLRQMPNENVKQQNMKQLFMDQFRWGDVSGISQSQEGWDWLVNTINLKRVQTTIKRFPIDDPLCPNTTTEDERRHDEENSQSLFDDQRYSPGFLLPLILCVLEEITHESHAYDEEGMKIVSAQRMSAAHMTQKLCDKGCLSLSLAALCSRHSSIRRFAVCILFLFKKVMDTKEARNCSSWRERPQLAMIINSIQRGLVLQRAESASLDEGNSSYEIPRFPGVTAIFLSRASLILAKPGDSMFTAMNRFFLRIEHNGGAFREWNKLPAFMSLFCSSDDEPGRAKKHRIWALELIQDGFVDDQCYRSIAACHAPELILTSIDNFRPRSLLSHDDECALLTSTILTVLSHGGEKAASHLIVQLGLLSWLRAVLVGRPTLELFPNLLSRITLIRLVSTATKVAMDVMPPDKALAVATDLVQPVIDLCLRSIDGNAGSRRGELSSQPSGNSIISATSQFLTTMKYMLIKEDAQGMKKSATLLSESNGLVLQSASKFLSLLTIPEQVDHGVLSLCSLPLSVRKLNSSDARSFCELVLDLAKKAKCEREEIFVAVLKRVSLLSTLCEGILDENGNLLLQQLLSCRRACAQKRRSQLKWNDCAEQLVRGAKHNHHTYLVSLIKDIFTLQ